VHDLHLWTLTSGMNVATAHLVAAPDADDVLGSAQRLLHDDYGVEHATLQVETPASACRQVSW
jgi:cobalt-zinc-cadmium efflux system protein